MYFPVLLVVCFLSIQFSRLLLDRMTLIVVTCHPTNHMINLSYGYVIAIHFLNIDPIEVVEIDKVK